MRHRRGALVVMLACLTLGVVVGNLSASEPPEPKVITKTEVRVKEVKKTVSVDKPYVPDSCRRSTELTDSLLLVVAKYEASTGAQMRIFDDAHAAILGKSSSALNDAATRQRGVKSSTLDDILELKRLQKELGAAQEDCAEDLKR